MTSETPNTPPNRRLLFQVVGAGIFLVLLILLFYTFLHEGGHALVGLLFGGRINGFSINFFDLSAHVGLDGSFTPWQHSLISAAGVSLPLLFGLGLILLAPRGGDIAWESFKILAVLVPVSSLLAWIVIPILILAGQNVSDDSAAFVDYSHLPPLLVSGVVLPVALASVWVAFRRLGGARRMVERFRNAAAELAGLPARRTLISLATLGAVTLLVALEISLLFPDTIGRVPEGFQLVTEQDLSQGALEQATLYQFTLEQPSRVGLFVTLQNIERGPVKIWLSGPEGYENVFLELRDPQVKVGKASVNLPAMQLEQGSYQVLATLPQTRGRVKVFIKVD